MPAAKQVCVFSATYPQALDETLTQYMSTPVMVRWVYRFLLKKKNLVVF